MGFSAPLNAAVPAGRNSAVDLTAQERQWLAEHPVIRVAPDPDYQPIESFDDNGRLVGISAEYLALLENKLGIHFEIDPVSNWDEAMGKARSREVDMLSAATETAARSKFMLFTSPHIELPGVIIIRDEGAGFSSLEKLRGKKVGVVSNYVWQEWISRDHPGINLQPVQDMQTGLLLVSFGRLDAMVGNVATASHYLKQLGITNLRVGGETGYFARLGLATRKDWPELNAILQKAVNSLGHAETQAIHDKWIALDSNPAHNHGELIFISLLVVLGLAAATFGGNIIWNRSLRRMLRRQNASLQESEARLAGIMQNAADGIVTISVEGRIEGFNTAAEEIFGYRADEVLGRNVRILMPEPDAGAHDGYLQAFVETGRGKILGIGPREVEGRHKDGSIFPMDLAISQLVIGESRLFIGIARNISLRKQTQEALLAAKEDAELANRAKSEFLASMSHELRTPLNAIIGFSQMMVKEALGPVGSPLYLEYADDIHSSGEHLLALINDVLDISKIEAGKADLHEETVDLVSVIRSCDTMIQERAKASEISLFMEIADGNIPLVRADPRRLKQVLINLLSNAIKFTEPGGAVTLKMWHNSDSGCVLQIVDTGIGIAADDIPKALARFQQVDGDLGRKFEGTGLGLPLAKSLIELHGGSLDLQSQLGKGTTVTVRLPAERCVNRDTIVQSA